MKSLNPYLNFPGTTEDAFTFYAAVLGGEIISSQRFSETPEADRVPENEKAKMMHMAIRIGKDTILMATDALESMGHSVKYGNNFHLTINAESKTEADKFYQELSAGGTQTMPMADMFWGDYFGMLTDKFGIQWMVSFNANA